MMPMCRPTFSRYARTVCDARRLVRRGAVREVDAEDVGAREDQLLERRRGRRSRGLGSRRSWFGGACLPLRVRPESGTRCLFGLRLTQDQSEIVHVGSRRASPQQISGGIKVTVSVVLRQCLRERNDRARRRVATFPERSIAPA